MCKRENLTPIIYHNDTNCIEIIDQTKLPNNLEKKFLHTSEEVWEAIKKLEVRGAPLIGITAAYGLAMAALQTDAISTDEFISTVHKISHYLMSARPTAVNLENCLNRMTAQLTNAQTVNEAKNNLLETAVALHQEDIQISKAIGHYGNMLLENNTHVITYCNAGLLATSNTYGTALAPVYTAVEENKHIEVFACETRPVLQGARLTTFELTYNDIPTTLITDNMMGWLLSTHKINAVFVGCDRVAINGDFANKIGTYTLAVMAKRHNVPFYVCTPSTTIDFNANSLDDIIIEMRNPEEVRALWYAQPMVTEKATILNPAFDCTPNDLVTGFITERGILKPPFSKEMFEV